jgi:AAA15 family ATPase/GTPase
MLLEFQVENYLSFKELTKLSMIASSSTSTKDLQDSIVTLNNINILTSAAIFGANASGKSNLVNAIKFMSEFVSESAKESTYGKEIEVDSFKLNEETINEPSTFEITFIAPNNNKELSENKHIIFRYGFQLSRKKVESEWLFARFTASESRLFTRDGNNIDTGTKFKEGKQVLKTVGDINKTTLFLSLIANIKGDNAPITGIVMNWFKSKSDITSIADDNFLWVTAKLMKRTALKKHILKAMKYADIGIEDITAEENNEEIEKLPNDFKKHFDDNDLIDIYAKLRTNHNVYNSNNEKIDSTSFDFKNQESDGTKKFFALIGPILAALFLGNILVIDEMDARLHPNLYLVLVTLFNSKKINKKNAQLIFATHNTLVMNKRYLRRDQIYLTKKDKYGASELYSLLDYKSVRNDATFNKDYLMGKYDAVPYLGNFESIFNKD